VLSGWLWIHLAEAFVMSILKLSNWSIWFLSSVLSIKSNSRVSELFILSVFPVFIDNVSGCFSLFNKNSLK
jgi:hypothetical protein